MVVLEVSFRRQGFALCWILLFILTQTYPACGQVASTPAVGAWNRYLGQSNIIECWNASDAPARAEITLRDRSGSALKVQEFSFPAHGSFHYSLDQSAPADSYGTYAIRVLEGDDGLRCTTLFYRLVNGTPQFSYSLPILSPLSGKSFGFYNSYHPANAAVPIFNWLAIYNPGTTPISADLLVYGLSGELEQTIPIENLPVAGRIDIALGHPMGQRTGMYEIRPRNLRQPYGAYLARFVLKGNIISSAYSFLPLAGSGTLSVVGTSTMGNAQNWLEIGNTSAEPISVNVELQSQTGARIQTRPLNLAPYAQQHVYVNEALGREAIGKAKIRCVSRNCSGERTLVQSVFYGLAPGDLRWAYGTQGLPLGAGSGQELSFPLNTFLGAANWLKIASYAPRNIELEFSAYSGNGRQVDTPPILSVNGTLDLPLHELLGIDGYGYASVASTTSAIGSELIRVFPGALPGEIQHINPIRSVSEYNRGFQMVRSATPSPGRLSGSFDSLERQSVIVDGHAVEKVMVRGWACRIGSSAPITVVVKAGDRIIGRGTANRYRPAVNPCPGMQHQAFSFAVTLPSDLSLSGLRLSAVAADELGQLELPHFQTAKTITPGLIYSALDNRYPKGIFFRAGLENDRERDLPENFPQWVKTFSGLDGAFAKVLNEEIDSIDSTMFASGLRKIAAVPGQLTLLHYNGTGMLPTSPDAARFLPKDWLYLEGCDSVGPVSQSARKIILPEACFAKFRKCLRGPHSGEVGTPSCNPENLVAVQRKTDGTLDWSKYEYLIVEDLRRAALPEGSPTAVTRTELTLKRGQFRSSAHAYSGKVYLAPFSRNGPWKKTSDQVLWNFNFAQPGLRQRLADLITSKFAPNGPLVGVDGITLDVSWWYRRLAADADAANQLPGREIDIDVDSVPDQGYSGAVNLYGRGVSEFHRLLKAQLGPHKLMLADGGVDDSSRDFDVLNGTENEGLGDPNDPEFTAWSTGINRLLYTQNRTAQPNFRYIVHKNVSGAASARLVMAGSQALEAAFANIVPPATEMFTGCTPQQWDSVYGAHGLPILDEMVKGVAREKHWLGAPAEGLRRPALVSPVVHPDGVSDLRALITPGNGKPVTITHRTGDTVLTPGSEAGREFSIAIPGLSAAANKDMVLELEVASLGSLDGFEARPDMPRSVRVSTTASIVPPRLGARNPAVQHALFGPQWTRIVVYFRNEQAQNASFGLQFEGTRAVRVRNIKLHHAPDVLIRRFENGIVIANPAFRSYTVNLAAIFPGRTFRRITATQCQDNAYNNGSAVGATVQIGPKDGLFLIDTTTVN